MLEPGELSQSELKISLERYDNYNYNHDIDDDDHVGYNFMT